MKDQKGSQGMRYKHILFDLDGTIMDSMEGVIASVLYAYDGLGLPHPPVSQHREFVGPPLHESFPAHGIPQELVWTAIGLYRERYNTTGKYEGHPYPGIPGLLHDLQAAGLPLYVATSKPEELSIDILTHFNLARYFTRIAGATEDASRADKEAVLRYLLSDMTDAERDDCVLIGDTIYDVEGAATVGLPCIGVTWGCGDPAQMSAGGAVCLVDDTIALKKLLLQAS